ncbi:hypothetical protein AAG565_07225 [Fontimonas sp. SYSU GA230001]|uniref:hypothetical protein n=1 Tax=Fontimonas sp. SYSU GA230001 TaxID=3142450 RepID=UPI0032B5D4ED
MKPLLTTTVAAALLILGACGSAEDAPKPRSTAGREETRNIRNTEAVGYAGGAIADKLDSALDANDQRKEQLDQELDAQEQ